jgi:O-antigen/teichoic acid export membrane protein
MNWLSFLKLEYKHVWLIITGFLGTLAPGFLILFHFKPELFEKYDVFKLIILSLSLTLPLLIINSLIAGIMFYKLPDDEESTTETQKNVDATRAALSINALVIYSSLLFCYFNSSSFKHLLKLFLYWEIGLFIYGIIALIAIRKDQKKK